MRWHGHVVVCSISLLGKNKYIVFLRVFRESFCLRSVFLKKSAEVHVKIKEHPDRIQVTRLRTLCDPYHELLFCTLFSADKNPMMENHLVLEALGVI